MQRLPPYIVPFGTGPIFKDVRTGRVLTDQDRVVRNPTFSGEEGAESGDGDGSYSYEGESFDQFGNRARPASARPGNSKKPEELYESAILSENKTVTAAGDTSISLRAQHHFKAADMTFEGSPDGTLIKEIAFGDKTVFKSSSGVPASMFNPTSQLRKYLVGKTIRAGLDIIVTIYMASAGTAYCTFTGYKPKSS